MDFLTITVEFLPNGCFLAETILKGSILFVLMAFTGIMGHMRAPMFLPSWGFGSCWNQLMQLHEGCHRCKVGTRGSCWAVLYIGKNTLPGLTTFHDLREGIKMVCFTITMAFLSNGCFLAETLLKSSILLILLALNGVVGCVCVPMFLALCTAFLNFHLLGKLKFVRISTLMLTFSGGFLSTFLHGLILGIGICY